MSSCLGQIEAAAERMVSAADTAIRAKAKSPQPFQTHEEAWWIHEFGIWKWNPE